MDRPAPHRENARVGVDYAGEWRRTLRFIDAESAYVSTTPVARARCHVTPERSPAGASRRDHGFHRGVQGGALVRLLSKAARASAS